MSDDEPRHQSNRLEQRVSELEGFRARVGPQIDEHRVRIQMLEGSRTDALIKEARFTEQFDTMRCDVAELKTTVDRQADVDSSFALRLEQQQHSWRNGLGAALLGIFSAALAIVLAYVYRKP